MKHLKKIFEEKTSYHRFDKDQIEDICIDLIDAGWEIKNYKEAFYEEKDFYYSDLVKSDTVPGYFFSIESEEARPDFRSSQEMKEWFSEQSEKQRMSASVIKKLETQVGPVKVRWSFNCITVWVKEKSKIKVTSKTEHFEKFSSMVSRMLELIFYKSEYDISIMDSDQSISIGFKDRIVGDVVNPLSRSRFDTFMKRLKFLSSDSQGYQIRKKTIPYSHEFYYGNLDQYEFDVTGSFSTKKVSIKFKKKRK